MQPIVGIISEYDPFHMGHARQFALIRQALPDARIVCVMSGCFTQRGMPALFSPAFRARAALAAGADLVLELPCAFAVRDAENFALGGVSVLASLGFVSHLSFGCENDDLRFLQASAQILEHPNEAFARALRQALDAGLPFVAAQARAVSAGLASHACAWRTADAPPAESLASNAAPAPPLAANSAADASELLARPNNILAICYLRALLRLRSAIAPLPVLRVGEYHAQSLAVSGFPSASATRRAYLAGDISAASAACGYSLTEATPHLPTALDAVLLDRLRTADAASLQALPDCSEGLENRLAAAARQATSRRELLALLKTRRYAYTRLNRLATHALLNVTDTLLRSHPVPEFVRLLGFSAPGRALLPCLRQGSIPAIAKAADGDRNNPLFALDERAYDLWALGAGLPAGLLYREKIITP